MGFDNDNCNNGRGGFVSSKKLIQHDSVIYSDITYIAEIDAIVQMRSDYADKLLVSFTDSSRLQIDSGYGSEFDAILQYKNILADKFLDSIVNQDRISEKEQIRRRSSRNMDAPKKKENKTKEFLVQHDKSTNDELPCELDAQDSRTTETDLQHLASDQKKNEQEHEQRGEEERKQENEHLSSPLTFIGETDNVKIYKMGKENRYFFFPNISPKNLSSKISSAVDILTTADF